MLLKFWKVYVFLATTLEHAPLEAVYIYFDTATYDEIDRDEKVILYDNDFYRTHICTWGPIIGSPSLYVPPPLLKPCEDLVKTVNVFNVVKT